MRNILLFAAFIGLAVSPLTAAPLPAPTVQLGTSGGKIDDGGCPPGSVRDQAAVEQAGGDPKAIAQIPCVAVENAKPAGPGPVDPASLTVPRLARPMAIQKLPPIRPRR